MPMSSASLQTDDFLHRIHILIVGDAAIGKTAFVRRHITGKFLKKYEPTVDATDHHFELSATSGEKISLICGGTSDINKLDSYHSSTANNDHSKLQAAIIMFDVTALLTYQNVPKWYNEICRVYGPDIPIVLCGNKVDVKKRKVKTQDVTFHRENKYIEYFELSVKNNHNLEEPVLHLAEKLTGITGLQIVKTLTAAGEDADHGWRGSVKRFLDSAANCCSCFAPVVNVVAGTEKICCDFIIGCDCQAMY